MGRGIAPSLRCSGHARPSAPSSLGLGRERASAHAADSAAYGGFVMVSGRNGELKRSVLSALAAMVAAAVPSLVTLPAHAETPSGSEPRSDAGSKHEKHEAKRTTKKAHVVKGQKAHATKQEASAQKQETRKPEEAADAKPKPQASNAAKPAVKK